MQKRTSLNAGIGIKESDASNMKSEIAAWWGAIVSSVVLLWDIYKWKHQGPRLVMRLSPNMQVWGDPSREGKTWVSVTVSNVGDRPTTIKGVGIVYYKSWLTRLRNRAENKAVFPKPSDDFPLPLVLNPGDEWGGLIPQKLIDKNIDMEAMSQSGHLLIWVSRSDEQRTLLKNDAAHPEPGDARARPPHHKSP